MTGRAPLALHVGTLHERVAETREPHTIRLDVLYTRYHIWKEVQPDTQSC